MQKKLLSAEVSNEQRSAHTINYVLIRAEDYINGVVEESLSDQRLRESPEYEKAEKLLQALQSKLEYTSRVRCDEVFL